MLTYRDTVIIDSPDFQFYIDHLTRILFRFRAHGLKFKPQKSKLTGHCVSAKGIEINTKQTGLIKDLPVPSNTKRGNQFVKFVHVRIHLKYC
jgi:hypothetical protein